MTGVRAFLHAGCLIWAACHFAGQTPDSALLTATVEALAFSVEREYLDPHIARRAAFGIREAFKRGSYAQARTRDDLAELLTRDLFSLTRDKHLVVSAIEQLPSSAAGQTESREARAKRTNYGVQRVEILAGNVAYLNLTFFYRLSEARETLAAAMGVLHSAEALILDLRENTGGSADTAALVMSYLFAEEGLPLFDIVPREGPREQYRTLVPGVRERDGKRPLYVLTSFETFSAGEGLAFILQERGRAEVIGERTAGAANPGQIYPINASFEVTIPNGQVRTSLSRRNWEGAGVVPDIAVHAAEALAAAHARALSRLKEAR